MTHDSKNTPHAKASDTYAKQKQDKHTISLESQLLKKATEDLQKLYDNFDEASSEDIKNILNYNRKLWAVFFDSAIETPEERTKMRGDNIVNLCNFVFKRCTSIITTPDKEKLLVLIDINHEIAAGIDNGTSKIIPKSST